MESEGRRIRVEQYNYDYYYGLEGEQFAFFRIPKILITNKRYKTLSLAAKMLYGLMLERMSLSRKNKWLDEENRVYIVYSVEKVAEDLNCSQPTAVKALAELDSTKGIGLIERRKRGQGNPDIIYVKNFTSIPEEDENEDADIERYSKGHGNFLTYAYKAHDIFDESNCLESDIRNQVKRHWRKIDSKLKE